MQRLAFAELHTERRDPVRFVGRVEGAVQGGEGESITFEQLEDAAFELFDVRLRLAPFRTRLPVRRLDEIFDLARIGRGRHDIRGADDAGQAIFAEHVEQARSLFATVQIRLVEHDDDRLVDFREFQKGRVLDLVQVRIGDEENQVRSFRHLARHGGAVGTADFVDARRIDQHDLGLSESGQAVPAAIPRDMPDFFRPAAAHVHRRDGLADERVDQRRLAGADLAEHDDLDATRGELAVHLLQAAQVAAQNLPFLFGAPLQLG